MRVTYATLFLAAVASATPDATHAQELIADYIAVIGPQDRRNSSGASLEKLEQILAQDRANYHRFGLRDAGDTSDTIFDARENRAAIPDLVLRGKLSAEVQQAILFGVEPRIRVQVFGSSGRPNSIQVSLADSLVDEERTAQTTGLGGAAQSALPSFGSATPVWQFTKDAYEWRGTASVAGSAGWQIALACTRPGADPATYPGGHEIRPHEAGVYNMFLSPAAMGGDFGAPGTEHFEIAFSVDDRSFGSAPMIHLSQDSGLATNIPVDHPMIAAMASGASLRVTAVLSGVQMQVPLAGSSQAIAELASFCAIPLELGREIASPAGDDGTPEPVSNSSSPTLDVLEKTEHASRILVRFTDPSPGANPWITIVREGSAGSAYMQYFYTERKTAGEMVFNALPPGSYEVRFHTSDSSSEPVSVARVVVSSPQTAERPQDSRDGGNSDRAATSLDDGAATGIVCEQQTGNARYAQHICRAADGGRLTNEQYRDAYVQITLRTLGCDVAEITGDISTSQGAMECFRKLLTPPEGRADVAVLSDLALHENYRFRDDLISALLNRGYRLTAEPDPTLAVSQLPLDNTPARRVALDLPDPADGEYYLYGGYYYSDFDVPLSRFGVVDLSNDLPSGGPNSRPGFGYARWLREEARFLSPLLRSAPSLEREQQDDAVLLTWINELQCVIAPNYCTPTTANLFPEEVLAALSGGARVHACEYDRMGGTSMKPDLRAGGGSEWIKPRLHFWAQPMPTALSADALRNFSGSETGLHPLLAIGPYVEACPETLGIAAEYLAGRFPDLVPLAVGGGSEGQPSGDEGDVTLAVSSLEDARQTLVRELLGMTLAETNIDARGRTTEFTFLTVDTLDTAGPAFKAGLRSGDFVGPLGWAEVSDIATFARELDRRQDNGAVVLASMKPGEGSWPEAKLIPFAQSTLGNFERIERTQRSDAERPGWTTLAEDEVGHSLSVQGEPWCQDVVYGEIVSPIEAHQLMTTVAAAFDEGFQNLEAQCPDVQQAYFTAKSGILNEPINVVQIDFTSGTPRFQRLGLDGMPPASTVTEAREIALEHAPLCDRLSAHPADSTRRYGLEGVEYMAPDSLEQAIDACLAEVEQNPDDPLANFHLGRALYEAGLFEDAVGFLEIAAAGEHGGALDYLGQMYADGSGIEQDYDLADEYFVRAEAAGFNPFSEPEVITFDTTGATRADVVQYLYEMSYRLMPQYANRDGFPSEYNPQALRFFFSIVKEVNEACKGEDAINRLYSALEEGRGDADHLTHAIFMYESYLPTILPVMAQRVGQTMDDSSEGGVRTGFALTGRYSCESIQLRQLVLNAAELIVR